MIMTAKGCFDKAMQRRIPMKRTRITKTLFSLLLVTCMLVATLATAAADETTPLKFLTVSGKEAEFDAVVARWN